MTGVIAEGVGVKGLVGDQSAGIDGFDQQLSASQIVILAGLSITSTGLPRASTST